jgi:hypothetical protein
MARLGRLTVWPIATAASAAATHAAAAKLQARSKAAGSSAGLGVPIRATIIATPSTAPSCRIVAFTALPTPKRSDGSRATAALVSVG